MNAQVKQLAEDVQAVTQNSVEVAFVDEGYTGEQAQEDAKASGIDLIVIKLPEAEKGFVLLPRRWVVERSFAWPVTLYARLKRCAAFISCLGVPDPYVANVRQNHRSCPLKVHNTL